MSKENMFAKVILASTHEKVERPLFTMHWRYPRIIHAEVMTHRVLSRNARSSRAVPVATMLAEIRDAPFVPWHWGKNQKGMQASEENNATVELLDLEGPYSREGAWLRARDYAVEVAEGFADAQYHKQVVNRLVEPFMWIDTLVTGTNWANFMHLRDHKDAEPHFRDLAQMVKEAMRDATIQTLKPGEWHLPYVEARDRTEMVSLGYAARDMAVLNSEVMGMARRSVPTETLQKLSVARSARISYAPFDGNASVEKEIERYDLLVGSDPLHASPAEHQATPDVKIPGEVGPYGEWRGERWTSPWLGGNLGPGWIQYRKTLANEYVRA